MDVGGRIAELSATLSQPDLPGPELLPTRLMRATALTLPVSAAGISVFSGYRHRVPLGASDDVAALAERLQFTVGEGPCMAAHEGLKSVLATAQVMAGRWPAFHDELVSRTPYRTILSIPIVDRYLGGDAAMDLYYEEPNHPFDESQLTDIDDAADVIAALLVAGSGLQDPLLPGPVWLDNEPVHARSLVWTALGMIDVALDLPSPDALSVLRAYAYSRRSTIDDVARCLVTRELPVEALRD